MWQRTLTAQESARKCGRKTWREKFLEAVGFVISWVDRMQAIAPSHPKAGSRCPGTDLGVVKKVYLLLYWFNPRDLPAEMAQHEFLVPSCLGADDHACVRERNQTKFQNLRRQSGKDRLKVKPVFRMPRPSRILRRILGFANPCFTTRRRTTTPFAPSSLCPSSIRTVPRPLFLVRSEPPELS